MRNIAIPASKFEPGACCRHDRSGNPCAFTLVTATGAGLKLCWLHCLELGVTMHLDGSGKRP